MNKKNKESETKNSGIWQGFAGAIGAALIAAFALKYCQPSKPEIPDTSKVPTIPSALEQKKVTYIITLKTVNEKKAGTDSDIRVDFYKGSTITNTMIFFGGRGDKDVILEQGTTSPEQFEKQNRFNADSVTLTLLKPTGNGGHWYGNTFNVHIPEQSISMCSTGGLIGWLKAGNPQKNIKLVAC